MPIEIIDDPVVRLTVAENAYWRERYNRQFSGYGFGPPTFASWVQGQLNQKPLRERIKVHND